MRNRLPKQSGVEIKYSGDSNISIQGDWVLIRWAVENLMKNAVDAMGTKSGDISIILTQTEAGTQLDLSDTGKGIPRSDWKNIFRPGHSSKPRGWGLGLSLTKRIVEEIHGGSIKVLRSKPGKTVFRLTFPL